MRRFVCGVLAALLMLAGCSNNHLTEPSQLNSDVNEAIAASQALILPPSSEAAPPDGPDFYDELYSRNARIVASFDFNAFSVWFAITPKQDPHNQNRWDFANGGHMGIPLTVAVVRKSAGRAILVEEVPVNLDLRLHEWAFDALPQTLPAMQNRHLKSRDGYMFTNFFDTDVFRGTEWLRRQALMVCSNETVSLLCQAPIAGSDAAGEHIGGMLLGMHGDNNLLRHIILSKEGVLADSTLVTKGDYKNQFYTLSAFDFAPETNTITLGRITANANGITEAPYETAFEILAGGEVSRADNLLGLSAKTLTEIPQGNSIVARAQYPVIGSRIYRFPYMASQTEAVSELRYDSFDLQTHTHKTDRLLYDFGDETVTGYAQTETGFRANTDAAVYFFDDTFQIVGRIPRPANTGDHVFNEARTRMAFRGEVNGTRGIYLLNLEANAPPALLSADIPWDWDSSEPYGEGPFPIRFIGDDRLFIGVSVWESAFFRIIDSAGSILEEFPFHASGLLGGGYNYSNRAMTIFLPMQGELGPHYYDFESRTLACADWWGEDDLQDWDYYTPDPTNPYVWYVCSAHLDRPAFPRQVERSEILRLDFAHKTVQPLIGVLGTQVTLLSAGKNGELVFAFASDMDSGFAVFSPEGGADILVAAQSSAG